MKKKVRFNLLDAAILLVAVGLVLSFVFRAELARIVSGAEEAAYTVTFTVVTTPENGDMPMAEAKRGLSKVAASQTVPRPMSAAQRTRHSN